MDLPCPCPLHPLVPDPGPCALLASRPVGALTSDAFFPVSAAPLWCQAVWSTADDYIFESSQKAEEECFLPCDAHGPGSRQPVADLGTEGLTGPEEGGPGPLRGL